LSSSRYLGSSERPSWTKHINIMIIHMRLNHTSDVTGAEEVEFRIHILWLRLKHINLEQHETNVNMSERDSDNDKQSSVCALRMFWDCKVRDGNTVSFGLCGVLCSTCDDRPCGVRVFSRQRSKTMYFSMNAL
jgi:hypothetical protein